MIRLFAAGAVAIAMWATPAAAETLDVICEARFQMHRLRDGVVTELSNETRTYQVSVDTVSGVFTSGNDVGVARTTAEQIIAIQEAGPAVASYWAINRTNGEFFGSSSGRSANVTVFGMLRGQCRTVGGATSF